jgi:hypothetical protein
VSAPSAAAISESVAVIVVFDVVADVVALDVVCYHSVPSRNWPVLEVCDP